MFMGNGKLRKLKLYMLLFLLLFYILRKTGGEFSYRGIGESCHTSIPKVGE